MLGRSALLVAVALQLTMVSSVASAACEQDVADLERVIPTLTMPTDLRREGEALQSQAGSLCQSGDQAGATSKVEEAWTVILDSDEVAARTVAELATANCVDAAGMVRERVAGATEVGDMGRDMARLLIEDAVQLCAEDERILAEEKLALAVAILSEE
ncbi:MAG: hypothetical protein R3349_00740 [Geminicoccaceae bacterium]|nr:hypothetical protein [Geminicoccaceae bacterium]